MRRAFRRPSPATAISLIALLVALSGTSYAAIRIPANSVGAKQLRSNAVTAKKIRSGAITPAKLSSGTLGMLEDDPGFTRVVSRQATVTGTQVARAVATCAAGETLIGGGAISTSGVLGESMSGSVDGGTPTDWRAIGVGAAGEQLTVVAEAICAS